MAVAAVYELAVPSPYDADFADGELALSVATTITGATGNTTYYLSRWFDFEGGVYTFKCVADDSALWIAAIEQTNGRVLFSNTIADGVSEITTFIPRGRARLDITLVNTSSGTSGCWAAFSLWQYGKVLYTSSGAGWVFDTAVIPDDDVPAPGDRRLTYPLFATLPNWKNGVTERLSYGTEVMSSEQDEEQRRSYRLNPRRTIEASFMRHGVNRARLDFFFTGVGKKEVLVPLWHEQYILTEALTDTLTFPEATLELREFHAGDLAAVIDTPNSYEILLIEEVDLLSDTITFAAAPSGTWPAGTRIFPLRVGQLIESPQVSGLTDTVGVVQARFTLDEPQTWPTASWGYCAPLFRFKVNRAQSIDFEFDRSVFMLDNDTGVIDVFDPGERTRVSMKCGMNLLGRNAVVSFRQFLQKARGRAVRFWMPDLMADIFPVGTEIGGTYFDAFDSQFSDRMFAPQDARRMLGFYFRDGRPAVYRRIASVDRVGDYERYTLTLALPPIIVSELSRVGFVMPVRFDQDSFELNHLVDDSAAVRTSIVVRSSESEGLPEIECFITSKPYPVDHIDSLGVTFGMIGGEIREMRYDPEAVDSDATLLAATLRDVFVEYESDPEGLDTEAALIAGVLRSTLIGYTNGLPEGLDSVAAIMNSSNLRVALISYTNGLPEGLNTTFSLVGGTLT